MTRTVWTCPVENCEGSKAGHLCTGYCRECGTLLVQVPLLPADNLFCPNKNCRASISPADKFCGACGTFLPKTTRIYLYKSPLSVFGLTLVSGVEDRKAADKFLCAWYRLEPEHLGGSFFFWKSLEVSEKKRV